MDLAPGVIHVRRGWDAREGEIATKSGKDRRVPIAVALRDHLDEHLLGLDWKEGLVFGVTAAQTVHDQAADRSGQDEAWKAREARTGSRCTSAATHSRR